MVGRPGRLSAELSRPRLLRALVWLIAAHSLAVGLGLLFVREWGLKIGGWTEIPPAFFPMQGGAFHVVVAVGYVVEYERHGTITLLLIAKAIGTAFLVAACLLSAEPMPWAVPASAAGDAAMGLAAWWVKTRTEA